MAQVFPQDVDSMLKRLTSLIENDYLRLACIKDNDPTTLRGFYAGHTLYLKHMDDGTLELFIAKDTTHRVRLNKDNLNLISQMYLRRMYGVACQLAGLRAWDLNAALTELEKFTPTPDRVSPAPVSETHLGTVKDLVGRGGLVEIFVSPDGRNFVTWGGPGKWVKVEATAEVTRSFGPEVDVLLDNTPLYQQCPVATQVMWRFLVRTPVTPATT